MYALPSSQQLPEGRVICGEPSTRKPGWDGTSNGGGVRPRVSPKCVETRSRGAVERCLRFVTECRAIVQPVLVLDDRSSLAVEALLTYRKTDIQAQHNAVEYHRLGGIQFDEPASGTSRCNSGRLVALSPLLVALSRVATSRISGDHSESYKAHVRLGESRYCCDRVVAHGGA
jgi:hypothetical protein